MSTLSQLTVTRAVMSSYKLGKNIACVRPGLRVRMQMQVHRAPASGRYRMPSSDLPRRGGRMRKTWTKPKVVEIAVGMEINSYACAELKK